MISDLLLDQSAYARLRLPALATKRSHEVLASIEAGSLAVSLPFLLEAGYSARSYREHSEDRDGLLALPRLVIDEAVEDRALEAQGQLARSAHHRLPPMDLVIAALAACNGYGILHYDKHFDTIAKHSSLRFDSVWLAPQGSL